MIKYLIYLSVLISYPLFAAAHDQEARDVPHLNSVDEYFDVAVDFDKIEIETHKINNNLYILKSDFAFGNIVATIGKSGVLIVDDDGEQNIPKIKSRITDLGGGDVDFSINTHWHFDHTNGNRVLGPEGSWIIAQTNSRQKMAMDQLIYIPFGVELKQAAYPEEALPIITFDNSMRFHFNGEDIDLIHFGPAHTAGDAVVYFRKSNFIHMGDVYNNAEYPYIDADNGGTLDGMISFCREVLKIIDDNTIVLPGHGAVSDYKGLEDYTNMLSIARDKIVEMMNDGATLNDIYEANLTASWNDSLIGDPRTFIERAYTSLKNK